MDGTDREGLIFSGDEPPDDGDFLHFALVIGVAAVILALAVNLAVGLL